MENLSLVSARAKTDWIGGNTESSKRIRKNSGTTNNPVQRDSAETM